MSLRAIFGVLGTDLRPYDKQAVLRMFVHRYTGDHKPAWADREWKDGKPYPVQFSDDQDWLANTSFAVRQDGYLDQRCKHCHSRPTWPNNPELRKEAA